MELGEAGAEDEPDDGADDDEGTEDNLWLLHEHGVQTLNSKFSGQREREGGMVMIAYATTVIHSCKVSLTWAWTAEMINPIKGKKISTIFFS